MLTNRAPVGLGGGEHAGLQAGNSSTQRAYGGLRVWYTTRAPRVTSMVNCGIGGVAAHHLNLLRYSGGAGAVDHPDGLAAAEQGVEGGEADRAGTEDDVTWQCCSCLVLSRGAGRVWRRPSRWRREPAAAHSAAPRRGRRR